MKKKRRIGETVLKVLIVLVAIAFVALVIIASLTAQAGWQRTETESLDLSDCDGQYDQFAWKWSGADTVSITTSWDDGGSAVDFTGATGTLYLSEMIGTNYIVAFSATATVSTSNLTFEVAAASMPAARSYYAEIQVVSNAVQRTCALGTVAVFPVLN